ncbi:isochorismatase family protein [Streptomyces sp. NPDC005438]|uniref:isochorismatase family protein n=1 Tax=Streptomyces sp. NPDC005438 TaxID=3156880 RepID=UPI0033AB3981
MADRAGVCGDRAVLGTDVPPARARPPWDGQRELLPGAAEESEDALPPPEAGVALVTDVVPASPSPRAGGASRDPADRTGPRHLTARGPYRPAIRSSLDATRAVGPPRLWADGTTARGVDEGPSPARLEPAGGDFVLDRSRVGAFFGTPLASHPHLRRVDALVVAGTTTSGRVRTTVTEAASHRFDRPPLARAAHPFAVPRTCGAVVDARTAHRLPATARRPEE